MTRVRQFGNSDGGEAGVIFDKQTRRKPLVVAVDAAMEKEP
jgi:hypothetical protein